MSDSDLLPFRARLLDYMSKVDEASPLQAMDDLRGEYGHKKYFTKEKVIEDFLSMQANEQVVQTALDGALSPAAAADGRDGASGDRGSRNRRGGKGSRNRKGKGSQATARYGALDDGWDDGASVRGGAAATGQRARRSPACELVPLDPGLFPGVPLLPVSVPGTLCVRPTDRYEGFFVARLKRL